MARSEHSRVTSGSIDAFATLRDARHPALPAYARVLVTGVSSIHGWPIFRALSEIVPSSQLRGIRPPRMQLPSGSNISSVCITDRTALQRLRSEFSPTHVIHGAGVCDLDVCEERPQWAESLNVDGCRVIAEVFGASAYIMHLSTDLVFSGESPPHEGYAEDAVPDPISVAGRTFADGEREIAQCPRHCIVRLGLPFGASVTGDKGARDWVAGRLRKGRPVTLFVDEWRSVIECDQLAEAVVRLLAAEEIGLFHCGGDAAVSLHQVGERVVAWGGFAPELLNGILRHEEKNGPPRIGNVALDSRKLRGVLAGSRPASDP